METFEPSREVSPLYSGLLGAEVPRQFALMFSTVLSHWIRLLSYKQSTNDPVEIQFLRVALGGRPAETHEERLYVRWRGFLAKRSGSDAKSEADESEEGAARHGWVNQKEGPAKGGPRRRAELFGSQRERQEE